MLTPQRRKKSPQSSPIKSGYQLHLTYGENGPTNTLGGNGTTQEKAPFPSTDLLFMSRSIELTTLKGKSPTKKEKQIVALALCTSRMKGELVFASFGGDGRLTEHIINDGCKVDFANERISFTDENWSRSEWIVPQAEKSKLEKFKIAVETTLNDGTRPSFHTGEVEKRLKEIFRTSNSGIHTSSKSKVMENKAPEKSVVRRSAPMVGPGNHSSRGTLLAQRASAANASRPLPPILPPVKTYIPAVTDSKESDDDDDPNLTPAGADARRSLKQSRMIVSDFRRTQEAQERERKSIIDQYQSSSPSISSSSWLSSYKHSSAKPLGYASSPRPEISNGTLGRYGFLGSSSPWLSTRSQQDGFRNVGNSCYVNAVLQTLIGMPSFLKSLQDPRLTSAKAQLPLRRPMPADSVVATLFNLAIQRNLALQQSDRNGEAVDTKQMKEILGRRNSMFSGYRQQDAHEFFSECLNFIHEDVERCLLTDDELQARDDAEAAFAKSKKQRPVSPIRPRTALEESKQTDAALFDSLMAAEESRSTPSVQSVADAAFAPSSSSGSDVPASAVIDDAMMGESELVIGPSQPIEDEEMKDGPDGEELQARVDRHRIVEQELMGISPVFRNFHCQLELELTCSSCGLKRKVMEDYHDFSVDLPEKPLPDRPISAPLAKLLSDENKANKIGDPTRTSFDFVDPKPTSSSNDPKDAFDVLKSNSNKQFAPPIHLTHLVQQFFQPRIIEYRCECKQGETLKQTLQLSQLPRILVLHLKRFQFDERRQSFQKRKDIVKFDNVIDMTPFTTDDVEAPPQEDAPEVKNGGKNLLDQFHSSRKRERSKSPDSPRTRKIPKRDQLPISAGPNDSDGDVEMFDSIDDDDPDMAEALKLSRQTANAHKSAEQLEQEQLDQALAASIQSAKDEETRKWKRTSQSAHTYRLKSVIIHKGETAGSGHYVSHILVPKSVDASPASSSASVSPSPSSTVLRSMPASSSLSMGAAGASPSARSPLPVTSASKTGTSPRPNTKTIQVWNEYDDARVTPVSVDTSRIAVEKEGYIFFYTYEPNLPTQSQTEQKHATNVKSAAER